MHGYPSSPNGLVGTPVGPMPVTFSDLSAAVQLLNQTLEDHKQSTRQELRAFEAKIHAQSEYVDKGLGGYVDRVHNEIAEWRKAHKSLEDKTDVAHASLIMRLQANLAKEVEASQVFKEATTKRTEALENRFNSMETQVLKWQFFTEDRHRAVDDIVKSRVGDGISERIEQVNQQLRKEITTEMDARRVAHTRFLHERALPLIEKVQNDMGVLEETFEKRCQDALDVLRKECEIHKEGMTASIEQLIAEAADIRFSLEALAENTGAKFTEVHENMLDLEQTKRDLAEAKTCAMKAALNCAAAQSTQLNSLPNSPSRRNGATRPLLSELSETGVNSPLNSPFRRNLGRAATAGFFSELSETGVNSPLNSPSRRNMGRAATARFAS